ncbi:hypothetical protein ONV78_08470 [Hahella sp. CR1]|uniref:hypothetical protein n=1 Tax=Hahella sp. CR1 TaxID=2992807 RepID=UPI002440FD91|nr:hypothetical protein [Hahella sp. CR1]MDG9667762.1 hypothetical protein [Hahella sp. CR1]
MLKTKVLALAASCMVCTLSLTQIASASDRVAQVDVAQMAAAERSFYYPQRMNQYGRTDYIFIDATNGTQFCKEEGYNNSVGGSILCGEDESSYITFDWYQQQWVSKSTGSKNQCYPLYRTITCR